MSAPVHSGHCPRPRESPTFWKENTFLFCSIKRNLDLQMNSLVYPLDYATWRGGHQHAIQIIINLAEEPLLLVEETLLGYYEREDEENMIVDHEGLFEINIEKPWEDGELEDKLFPPGGMGLSPPQPMLTHSLL